MKNCECSERIEITIDSYSLFDEIKIFFNKQVKLNIFNEIQVKTPFYIGKLGFKKIKWYATKWYKCNKCNCLWEFDYPDFPKACFVRKFEDGKYYPS